jgi:hypothetical protein
MPNDAGRVIIRDGKEIFVMPDGQECGMGLKLPDPGVDPTEGFKAFGDSFEVWDDAKIRKVLDDPERKRARELFPPEQIKDQDGRGACVGYATAGAEEEAQQMEGLPYVALSGDGVYAAINGGRDNGAMLNDAMTFIQNEGAPFEADVKRWEYIRSRIPADAYTKGQKNKGRECFVVKTEQELLTCIAMGMRVVIAVQASGGFSQLDQYGISKAGNGSGNHCTLIDDAEYNKQVGKYLLDMRNSWRTSFGEQGRCKLIWERHLATSVKYARFWALPNTTGT